MSLRPILLKAAKLVERGWTQGSIAETAEGAPCESLSPNAVRFCAMGAIKRAVGHQSWSGETEDALDTLRGVIGGVPISIWNDSRFRTQAEVVAALRQAAEKADQL